MDLSGILKSRKERTNLENEESFVGKIDSAVLEKSGDFGVSRVAFIDGVF